MLGLKRGVFEIKVVEQMNWVSILFYLKFRLD